MKNTGMDEFPLLKEVEGIPLFYPHVPVSAIAKVLDKLSERWIGQGTKVDMFEKRLKELFLGEYESPVVVSESDALRLAYLPTMDVLEDRYIVLPLHIKMGPDHVNKICEIANSRW
jgi:dTDP-4-amino-4,6-dideoxygalactose transaminase